MIDKKELTRFIEPYYADIDIMHNLWHIELMKKSVDKIIAAGNYDVNHEHLMLAMCFHGFIYTDEAAIQQWLAAQHYSEEAIAQILQIAWESQRPQVPETLEGKILHDGHVLEGGKTYLVTKTLITGSVRGQTFRETLSFRKDHVLGKNKCYLPETIPMCDEMNRYTDEYFAAISAEIG